MEIRATVLMKPVAKGRPKATIAGGHPRMYTPARTRDAEEQIIYSVRQQVGPLQPFPRATPVRLIVVFYRARPKNLAKKVSRPVARPDLDNYLKLLKDALNGFAYEDDAQVTTIMAKKLFAEPGSFPRIELLLEEDA